MNENTAFDLEWAKRGGVVKHTYAYKIGTHPKVRLRKYLRCDAPGAYLVDIDDPSNSVYLSEDWHFDGHVEMATRAECEAAGLAYIERPVSAGELASLREDNDMLEYIFRVNGNIGLLGTGEFGFYERAFTIEKRTGMGKTPREAIRAAMKVLK